MNDLCSQIEDYDIKKERVLFDRLAQEKNYPKLWDMLNNGGIFISDDINDNMSFFKFCDVINKKPLVIKYKKKFQGIILK